MSPIFVRPVREQLEHDRLIRALQNKYKRRFDAAMNVADERAAPVKAGDRVLYPDLVLTEQKKLAGLVEVETSESVNSLEALAEWVPFSRRGPFYLYVPIQAYDAARRLCETNGVTPAEIWTYRMLGDEFDLVRMHHDAAHARPVAAEPRTPAAAGEPRGGRRPAAAARTTPPPKRSRASARATPARPAPTGGRRGAKKPTTAAAPRRASAVRKTRRK